MTTLNKLRLSERMLAVESMVLSSKAVADIGTDHGFIPADLLLKGICPFAVMTDVNEGPLEKCRKNMADLGLSPDLYELRLGNGFEPIKPEEVSTVIIAGMGGELIQSMFENVPYDPTCFERIVLQPRTHADDLRAFLTESSFKISDYRLARERGRICEIFAVEPCSAGEYTPDNGLVSAFLLEKHDPLLSEFVDRKIHSVKSVLLSLGNAKKDTDKKAVWNAVLLQFQDIRRNL